MSEVPGTVRQPGPLAPEFPRQYNAADDLIGRNLAAGRGDKVAVIDDRGATTYRQLAERVARFANAIESLGIEMEDRVLLALHDTVDFPTAFLGAIKAGAVPVPVNTLLTGDDFAYMLDDSRARLLVVSQALLPVFAPILAGRPHLRRVIVSGDEGQGHPLLSELLAQASAEHRSAPTTRDDVAFWLYTSGSTGAPKGALHLQTDLACTAELYGRQVLGIAESDTVFSAAKLFFAYGLGNGLTFPFYVGATAVLMAERPTPEAVVRVLRRHRPTIFYGVPTLYASLLAYDGLPAAGEIPLRRCTSAGEALPADIWRRWRDRMGVEILDGLGSTEMLHIFISNRPGEARPGTSGKPVPGYRVRLVGEDGQPVPRGEIGELQIAGPTSAVAYWNQRDKSRATFQGEWTRSGDKYIEDEDGYFTYCGRGDDMLKVSGIYVSPFDVESALCSHEAVLEAAVVGEEDENRLVKPKAYVVLKPGRTADEALARALQLHVKERLAPYKYPRWIEFRAELPKTATGKIQRYRLRAPAVQDRAGADQAA
ncbi:MAG: benzoate-CoA ligase family protein [Pseudomonadota bacterium]